MKDVLVMGKVEEEEEGTEREEMRDEDYSFRIQKKD